MIGVKNMKVIQNIINNRLNKIIQGESNRNRAAMNCLKELGYPLISIRKSLIDLNEIRIPSLANGVSAPCLYNTLNGTRHNHQAKEILADSVGLEVKEMFPEAVNQ